MMNRILITGATGYLGKATINFLLEKGVSPDRISALVRDTEKAGDLQASGIQVIQGNYNDYSSLAAAFKGVDTLLFISSNDVLNRDSQHENVVKAATEAGIRHVVYTSALHNSKVESSAIAFVGEAHIKTEEWLKASGLAYTLLRNNLYMDLIPLYIGDKVLETGTVYFPAGNGRAAFALRADMAEAAANILASSGHEGKVYEITNVETYSYQDVADIISEVTGKVIRYVSPTVEEFTQTLKNAKVREDYIGFFVGFALAQAQGEFDVTGKDLEKLLGRKPSTLRQHFKTIYNHV